MRLFKLPAIYISLILICSLLLTACDEGNETTPVPLPDLMSPDPAPASLFFDDPDAVHLVECNFYGDYQENLDWKDAWPRLIEEHYGVKITIDYPSRENYMQTIFEAAKSGELTGIVELFGGPYVEEWMVKDLIYPLGDFLAENEVWNTIIPDHWKSAYTIEDEVWAIPTGSDGDIAWPARCIRGDWLDKFGLGKPYTIDEFYEASYKFTYEDPNENGRNDTVGFTSAGIDHLSDIFQAYDARLNHNERNTLVWNPNTDIWEDSMLKPEMVECLEFLKKCFSECILDPECFSGLSGAGVRERVSSGFYGGTVHYDSWILYFESQIKELFPQAYILCVGALAHNINKNLNDLILGSGGDPRVMMKTTPQPKETINWFVNTFFGDDWGFWTGRLGPVGDYPGQEGRVCSLEGKTVVRNTYIDQTGSIKTYPGPGYIGGLPSRALYTVYEVAYYVPSAPKGFENWAEDTAKSAMAARLRRKAWLDEYVENGMAYILPGNLMEPTSDLYLKFREDINIAMQDAIEAAVTGETSVLDAIAQYQKTAAALGTNGILSNENAKLGKTADRD